MLYPERAGIFPADYVKYVLKTTKQPDFLIGADPHNPSFQASIARWGILAAFKKRHKGYSGLRMVFDRSIPSPDNNYYERVRYEADLADPDRRQELRNLLRGLRIMDQSLHHLVPHILDRLILKRL